MKASKQYPDSVATNCMHNNPRLHDNTSTLTNEYGSEKNLLILKISKGS